MTSLICVADMGLLTRLLNTPEVHRANTPEVHRARRQRLSTRDQEAEAQHRSIDAFARRLFLPLRGGASAVNRSTTLCSTSPATLLVHHSHSSSSHGEHV